MEYQEHIRDRIVAYLLSNDTEISDPVLQEWLVADKAHRQDFDRYKKIWDASGPAMAPDRFDTARAWEKVNRKNRRQRMLRTRLKNIGYTLSGIAASVLIAIIFSWTGPFEKEQDISVSLTAGYGNRSEIVLPDGSTVKLNSGSEITYCYNSKEKERVVHFQGEGFFQVSKNTMPFIVKMKKDVEIKVLGTTFNLKAYPEDSIVQASLLEGRIKFECKQEKWVMKAGQMAEFDKKSLQLKQVEGDLSHSYGWLKNKLYMDDMSLADVCIYLERWYNVDIRIEGNLGDIIRYNGVIQEESITDVMEALSQLSNIAYHVKGRNIRITSK